MTFKNIKTAEQIAQEAEANAQEAINQEARQYLAETDWMVLREADGGEPMPAEIKQLRAEARERVV